MSTRVIPTFRDLFEAGSLDLKAVVSGELDKQGIKHRWEDGGKHAHAVYTVGSKEHRFPVSKGKRGDGALKQVMQSAIRRHVRAAQAEGGNK